jgi:hypothetical protein
VDWVTGNDKRDSHPQAQKVPRTRLPVAAKRDDVLGKRKVAKSPRAVQTYLVSFSRRTASNHYNKPQLDRLGFFFSCRQGLRLDLHR